MLHKYEFIFASTIYLPFDTLSASLSNDWIKFVFHISTVMNTHFYVNTYRSLLAVYLILKKVLLKLLSWFRLKCSDFRFYQDWKFNQHFFNVRSFRPIIWLGGLIVLFDRRVCFWHLYNKKGREMRLSGFLQSDSINRENRFYVRFTNGWERNNDGQLINWQYLLI